MNVVVLMFGALADRAAKQDTFDLPQPASAGDVVAAVRSRYPDASDVLERCSVAVNRQTVDRAHVVGEGDEVALLPPVSGGTIYTGFSPSPSIESVLTEVASPVAGGTVSFIGTVRDTCDRGAVTKLEYSAYKPMAAQTLVDIAIEAADKWALECVGIQHAIGDVMAGAVTFIVVCSAPHRDEAFDACRYVVDEVKRRAPIWKKEVGPWGTRWVGL